jgi:hypothetical protein
LKFSDAEFANWLVNVKKSSYSRPEYIKENSSSIDALSEEFTKFKKKEKQQDENY